MSKYIFLSGFALMTLPFVCAAEPISPEPTAPVCMTSTQSKGAQFTIAVAPTRQLEMTKRGFVSRPCGDLAERTGEYREAVCKFSRSISTISRSMFLSDMGISPDELCKMAMEFDISN